MRALAVAAAIAACLVTAASARERVSAGHAAADAAVADLTADQIVERNVAARGGLESWRKVRTMVSVGHMETASGLVPVMPFVLEQMRPDKTRFELTSMGHRSLRVFDGERGWKLHPGRDGKPDVQPYSAREIAFAQEEAGLDGPLIDHAAKGIAVALEGVEDIDGRRAYRLNLRLLSGRSEKAWIDAETFLELRCDRMSYNVAGAPGPVSVYYGDYRDTEGLKIPRSVRIGVGSGKEPDRMAIERVTINAPMNDRLFAWPATPVRPSAAGSFGGQAVQPAHAMASTSPVSGAGLNPDPSPGPR